MLRLRLWSTRQFRTPLWSTPLSSPCTTFTLRSTRNMQKISLKPPKSVRNSSKIAHLSSFQRYALLRHSVRTMKPSSLYSQSSETLANLTNSSHLAM
jgi:hypothetical protein